MNRLEQDAADALAGFEQQAKWRERVKADLARATGQVVATTWKLTMTEQQKQEFEQYAQENALPF